ncbi:MAG: GTP-binding protein [Methylobacter sp.]|nr:MAG: GTP-binding protein [Methylobacter sp.]
MLEFIQKLKQGYQNCLSQSGSDSQKSHYSQYLDQLLLAEAFIRKGIWLSSQDPKPLQIAVVGPTQAGKSSIVNVLLEAELAGVSPLAGYTVHPHGICHRLELNDCAGLQNYFGRFEQLSGGQPVAGRYDCYHLAASPHYSRYLPPCVLWDTPDFDSIDAVNYREGVIRTLALADVIILAVSKEKYADQSVWDMMKAVEALQQPTLICLNKLAEGTESLLLSSLQDKWRQVRQDAFPEVILLHYQKPTGRPLWPEGQERILLQIADKAEPNRKKQARLEQAFLQQHWQNWLQPVLTEHQLLADWQAMVEQALEQGLKHYRRDFLDHPYHYETFQYALTELLNLLELPGIAGILAGTRRVLTWPFRQLMKLGGKRRHIADTSHEVALLNQIAGHLLIQLADKLLDKTGHDDYNRWWQSINSTLRSQRASLQQDFAAAANQYHQDFQYEVEQAARQLYQKLQEQPLMLNSLRATRVTADAAAIALALHTGGIGLHDLVIAPAMLSLTSLLAESAIGSYVHKVEASLKQRQFDTVQQQLFIAHLQARLLQLPEQTLPPAAFNISKAQLDAAELKLKDKRHGLRLF